MCRVRPPPDKPPHRWISAVAWLALALAALARRADAQVDFEPDDYLHSTWARLEYLNFWVQKAPLSTPLVTTGDVAGMGRLGSPATDVLLGNSFRTPPSLGARFTYGGWIGDDEVLGGELSLFAVALISGTERSVVRHYMLCWQAGSRTVELEGSPARIDAPGTTTQIAK